MDDVNRPVNRQWLVVAASRLRSSVFGGSFLGGLFTSSDRDESESRSRSYPPVPPMRLRTRSSSKNHGAAVVAKPRCNKWMQLDHGQRVARDRFSFCLHPDQIIETICADVRSRVAVACHVRFTPE